MLNFLFVFITFIGLMILHEFGHFILAKKFGVRVEEFGIGYPPKLIGKKIGETVYSLNLLPFGAFVKLQGEVGEADDKKSFSQQTVGKRILVALGGVFSFWIVAAVLLSIVFGLGAPVAVDDEEDGGLSQIKVQIAQIAAGSPAEKADLQIGDTILKMKDGQEEISVKKVIDIQSFTDQHLGAEITLEIERGKNIFDVSLTPRKSPPDDEGPIGIALLRMALKKEPWYLAPLKGIEATGNLTLGILEGYVFAINNVFKGKPSGVQLMGPVGVLHMMNEVSYLGISYFLNFLATISVYMALFNLLPVPSVDGGKFLFLLIEKIRKKPINEKLEEGITLAFFSLLILLAIWVTIKDIARIF